MGMALACTPGKDGTCIQQSNSNGAQPSTISRTKDTSFCFTFYAQNIDSMDNFFELDLLRTQLFLKASIFGCEVWKVCSNVGKWLSPAGDGNGAINIVNAVHNNDDFHLALRKIGTWTNSHMLIATWEQINAEGPWSSKDWTVKVDVAAVFLILRLRAYVENCQVTDAGIYLVSYKHVNFRLFCSP